MNKELPEKVVADLCKRCKAGDQKAFVKLSNAYMWVIKAVCDKFKNCLLDYEDLVQEGSIGLWEAVKYFKPDKGLFSHFAFFKIMDCVGKAAENEGRTIKISQKEMSKRKKLNEARNRYYCEYGMTPSCQELAELTGMSEREVYEAEFLPYQVTGIDDLYEDPEDSDCESNILTDSEPESADFNLLKEEAERDIQHALDSKLSKRDAEIMRSSFGFKGEEMEKLNDRQLGSKFNLTPARIGQIKKKALKDLSDYPYLCRA